MKAIVYTRYGAPDVLKHLDVATPTPKDNEVLVRVHASSINAAETHLMRGTPWLVRLTHSGLFKPKRPILGADVAGQVEAVGKQVTQYRAGDAVLGDLSATGWGGYGEYVCTPETTLVAMPTNTTYAQAGVLPLAAVTALQALRDKGQLQAGQRVLIHGASGGVGSFAVQIAKAWGADVTGTCRASKMALVRDMGADHVIDYQAADLTQGDQRYDLILDIAAHRPFSHFKPILTPQGKYVVVGGEFTALLQVMLNGARASSATGQTFGNLMAKPNASDLSVIKTLVESGQVTPIIHKTFPLCDLPEAMRFFESGQAQSKISIIVRP